MTRTPNGWVSALAEPVTLPKQKNQAALTKALARVKHADTCCLRDVLLYPPYAITQYGQLQKNHQEDNLESLIGTAVILRILVLERPQHARATWGRKSRIPTKIPALILDDVEATLTPIAELSLVYFAGNPQWIQRLWPENTQFQIKGKLDVFGGKLQIAHPTQVQKYSPTDNQPVPTHETAAHLEPSYLGIHGQALAGFQQIVRKALAAVPKDLNEWNPLIENAVIAPITFADALHVVHGQTPLHLQSQPHALVLENARKRLAADEILARLLAIMLVRQRSLSSHKLPNHAATPATGKLITALKLPFDLTEGQKQTLGEIQNDCTNPKPMMRILQGDVGSGKTVIALITALQYIENGHQVALMAPTEILAQQHADVINPLVLSLGVRCALLTGSTPARQRQQIHTDLEGGSLHLVIGTHAILSERTEFASLGLAVVDEQHRFGVEQRFALLKKATTRPVDMLLLTATPIPRTLFLASMGDVEISRLTEKPAGRIPCETRVMSHQRLEELLTGLAARLGPQSRAFWVCPKIEDSEETALTAAQERFETIQSRFATIAPHLQIGLVHGRMASARKKLAIDAFASGHTQLLVTTTVIEVGIDVPAADIIIIEHAEHFGLAQLHQLRGRVGRNQKQGLCILIYYPPLSETAQERLSLIKNSVDGFFLAQEDLRLRREGDPVGWRQSGLPHSVFFQLERDSELIEPLKDAARYVLDQHRRLEHMKALLWFFQHDQPLLKLG